MPEEPSKHESKKRVKHRRRLLWKRMVFRSFLVAAGLLGLIVLYILWFCTGQPRPDVDYVAEFRQFTRPQGFDLNDNAFPYYEKAGELYIEADGATAKLFLNSSETQESATATSPTTNRARLANGSKRIGLTERSCLIAGKRPSRSASARELCPWNLNLDTAVGPQGSCIRRSIL